MGLNGLEKIGHKIQKTAILTGWKEHHEVPVAVRNYWNIRDELTVQDGLIFKSNRVLIPEVLRPEMLSRIHSSQIGIEACLRKARDAVFWPNMSSELRDFISKCSTCNEMQDKQPKQPLITHSVPKRPWAKLDTSVATVIDCLKQQFSRHGIPDPVISDNGPQFKSADFHTFACDWEFEHSTSSPYHSQSNGKAESAVKIAKRLVKKCICSKTDIWKALLDWRNTPTKDMDCSPVQRLMSRRTRHSLPTATILSYIINTDEKSYRRNRIDIKPTAEAYDANRSDSYKSDDDPFLITGGSPNTESATMPMDPKPQIPLESPTGIKTSRATHSAMTTPNKARSNSRPVKLPAKFKDYVMT
ncbi:uncharacterized protein K02A2.6-like [Saccostrea cucullata]|uniref:uncharacterized protein K02A2.6-like n=1 Tax=Saccostrea cuccullata TaxID=36930 RepID=UPI002ED66AD4